MKSNDINDFEKFEKLLQSKSYAELSGEEVTWVQQWVASEEEYEAMRIAEHELKNLFQINPVLPTDSKTLHKLKRHLRSKKDEKKKLQWAPFSLKPSLSYLFTAIVFGLLGWWVGHSASVNSFDTNNEVTTLIYDTVFMPSTPDTIFLEKTIYRDRPIILTINKEAKQFSNSPSTRGVTMKEKEELDELLVSGLD
jgi:hypothetical protein